MQRHLDRAKGFGPRIQKKLHPASIMAIRCPACETWVSPDTSRMLDPDVYDLKAKDREE